MARLLILFAFISTAAAQPGQPRDLSSPFQVAVSTPPEWRYLSQPSVHDELKITPAQKAAMERLVGEIDAATAEACSWLAFGYLPAEHFRQLIAKAQEQFLKSGLTQAQQQRLRQIIFQLKEREFGAHAAFTMAAKDLGLTGDQLEDVTSIKGQRIDEIAKLVTTGERFEKVKTKVEATNGDTFDKMTEMLTRTQREKFKAMKGRPFAIKVLPEPEQINLKRSRSEYPPELIGVYDFEVRYLESLAIRIELRLADIQEQIGRRQLAAWEQELLTHLANGGTEDVAKLHEKSAKILLDTLDAKQRTRFDQLMARRRFARGGWESVCGYPPVVSALKLTPVQLKALREGKTVEDVLAKSELEKLYGQVGDAFELATNIQDPIVGNHWGEIRGVHSDSPSGSFAFARQFLLIADRLGLSPEQIKKLNELAEDEPKFFDLIQRELGYADTSTVSTRSRPASTAVAEKFRDLMVEHCFNVLDAKQQSMARQIFGRPR